ncbi:24-hydroxycholesterol 7-alpha-hydroxylase isoform X1 [Canis lupus baileyi]|uniref:Cytochrome P450 family 39 subfamily A member 1 n=2 Tax=Canis lupus familiaris TaxID=9615 RepID=A0A8C0SF29_CANLF|nr:24-hydroxycholesterol 7-alpha-hydroxylase isoform X1 [Canis lupus familiaris]XP_025274724.1 24-hydroxycholesterol 7-alpha-hydroxylase isoform X1 [Canis lupus dingo]XP_038410170.1 24-hydroxycholesterol 7-alpha-hydroxylase isoform X1 [Canis lupus familiaris]XP_038539626.1 24-hydroxycholesterol 7-alpha-hydroxylase isoform X1 [Canis lupus familiaris]|eukprot:XP_005627475.1 24-hydroxycholesterol 7-alpha-hydroxylase isoform X1 [Canis lupus familiaris]
MELISPTVIIILGCVALLLFLQRKNLRGPPCIRGWIPWIGAGFEFGKAPLEFIEKARIKYGPIFTVFVMGNRMTFVTEEEGINVFLKSKEVNFELAVQNPVYRTASIPKNTFLALHEKLYIMMKGKIGTFNLYQFTGQLTEELHEQLENLGTHGTMELNHLVSNFSSAILWHVEHNLSRGDFGRQMSQDKAEEGLRRPHSCSGAFWQWNLLYPVTMNMLFKKGLFPRNEGKIREFYQHFQAYDEGFEYGSQMPECLLRNWSKSKKWLLALFEKNIPDIKTYKSAKDNSMTLMQTMLDIVEMERKEEKSPNYGLLLLWASLSNAVPVAFWTLAFVLSHPSIHKTIMEGVSSVFGTAGKDKMKVSEDDLKKLPLIKWCILEAIRLRAPGIITRKVLKPVKILNYTVPSGDLLMLSPFWLHRNPEYFPEPELFKPERWKKANLEKHAFLDWFMAFGSGKYQCPGRWFALLEIQICIILILYKYDCSLLDPLPKQSFLHLVGVQQPEGQCRIEFKQRK